MVQWPKKQDGVGETVGKAKGPRVSLMAMEKRRASLFLRQIPRLS
jgi:hypothetical protein